MLDIDYLTAETPAGQQALEEIARQAIPADFGAIPPQWAIIRRVKGVPVSFALVDPAREMRFARDTIPYAYIQRVATRGDRRSQGHFRGLLEEVFLRLKEAGIFMVVLHGAYQLYRRFGFEVFTYHSGIFFRPELIEISLGKLPARPGQWIQPFLSHTVKNDLLVVAHAESGSFEAARKALLASARAARDHQKSRILIEHPDAPSYGSSYPLYQSIETPLSMLATACGASMIVQGANPEAGSSPNADWIKVLDAPSMVRAVLRAREDSRLVGKAALWIHTDAGSFGLHSSRDGVNLVQEAGAGMEICLLELQCTCPAGHWFPVGGGDLQFAAYTSQTS